MTNPLVLLERDYSTLDFDPHWIRENRESAARRLKDFPVHYRCAQVSNPEIAEWVRQVIRGAVEASNLITVAVTHGPSLLVLGQTGTGKTYQAYGAIRALAESGASCNWVITTAADMYARLRPRHRVDAEEEFERYQRARVLVIDDLGAAKGSEFTEEINYRLVNHRYQNEMPTLITSNIPPKDLAAALGERVASRLTEMAHRVVVKGDDRRRNLRPSWMELSLALLSSRARSGRSAPLCAQTDPEAFFPQQGGSTREAKRICQACVVRPECLQFALDNHERFGIWGGTSERERRKLEPRDTQGRTTARAATARRLIADGRPDAAHR